MTDKSEVMQMLNEMIQSGEPMGRNTIVRNIRYDSYKWVLENALAIIEDAYKAQMFTRHVLNEEGFYD